MYLILKISIYVVIFHKYLEIYGWKNISISRYISMVFHHTTRWKYLTFPYTLFDRTFTIDVILKFIFRNTQAVYFRQVYELRTPVFHMCSYLVSTFVSKVSNEATMPFCNTLTKKIHLFFHWKTLHSTQVVLVESIWVRKVIGVSCWKLLYSRSTFLNCPRQLQLFLLSLKLQKHNWTMTK